MNQYKIFPLLLFFIFNINLKGQSFDLDKPLGYYHNGQIDFGYNNLNIEHFKFDQKTVKYVMEHPNKNIHFEFNKFNDTSFVYSEYYENPLKIKVDFINDSIETSLKRQGLAYIGSANTFDTIVVFDPETFDEIRYFDTLLQPIGKWKYYYPNGGLYMIGEFSKYGKENKWEIFENTGPFQNQKLEKVLVYEKNILVKDSFINVILEKNIKKSKLKIEGIWIFHDPKHNGGYEIDSNFLYMNKTDHYGSIGDTYHFLKDGSLHYEKTIVKSTEYIKQKKGGLLINRLTRKDKEINGSWDIQPPNTLVVILNNQKLKYKIIYLSDRLIDLEKLE